MGAKKVVDKQTPETVAQIRQDLFKELGLKNKMQTPRLQKIVLNIGGTGADKKVLQQAESALLQLAAQKPVVTLARKSEAGFKIREGWPLGVKVTLRDERMHSFYWKLVDYVLPRVRDFRGLSVRSFDGRGNYNLGIKEHICFPEIVYDQVETFFGLNITIVTNTQRNDHAYALLKKMHFPFYDKLEQQGG
jgi:large subunit ribosomal protein L5